MFSDSKRARTSLPLMENSGIFNVLVDRLATEDMRRFLLGRDSTNAHLSKLRKWMIVISKVASDAEEKQRTDPLVKDWLDKVKDAVYDAEDLIDEIHTEALRRRAEPETESSQGVGQLLSSITSNLGRMTVSLDPFHEGLDSRIEKISQNLEEFCEMINVLGLKAGGETPRPSLSTRSQTVSLVDESKICGRDSEREQIFRILQDGVSEVFEQGGLIKCSKFLVPFESRIRVVAIVGMPGIGKTTLAQLVFNDPRADSIFNFKVWTWVPAVFDTFQITSSILDLLPQPSSADRSYYDHHAANNNLELLQKRLRERLVGKKLLIVLDDIWDENLRASWQALCLSLGCAAPGSTILVTTRNGNIARLFHPIFTLQLHALADDDCLSLIKAYAFGDPLAAPDERLEDACKQVAKKCRGLPLAAKAVGCLLSFTSDAVEWEAIANSGIWDLPSGQKEILPALLLSYNFLPPHLKRCFAYCSIIPKNCYFEKEKLVLMWMAEGLIDQVTDYARTTEDCFHELLARSFFQESISNKHSFVMHDLIHELAVYVMGDYSFVLGPSTSRVASRRLRYFSYERSKYETAGNFGPIACADRLRTFWPVGYSSVNYLSTEVLLSLEPLFTWLRVLKLCNYRITSIPSWIGSLKHLRYLDFSSTLIEELPETVCSLYNLQTLLLSHCDRLRKLPTMMKNLVQMRHLDIRGAYLLNEMPEGMGRLRSLQMLTDFVVGRDRSASIRELGELSHLRGHLSISGLENVVAEADALEANLRDKAHLDELVLKQRPGFNRLNEGVLHELRPHTNLRRLTIVQYRGERFPDWVGDDAFYNLEVLRLEGCRYCLELLPLGQLPSLKQLLIEGFSDLVSVGPDFYGRHRSSSPFKSLEKLNFERMPEWKTWFTYEEDAEPFPCLQELFLKDCPVLDGCLPLELPSLKVLDVGKCRKLGGQLPCSPFLCELSLEDFGSIDMSSIASYTHLISLRLSWVNVSEDPHDPITSAQADVQTYPLYGHWYVPSSVRSITVDGHSEIASFLNACTCLQYLNITSVPSPRLTAGHLQMLNYLRIDRCSDPEIIPERDNLGLTSLYDLSIGQCWELLTSPAGGFSAPNLTTLFIDGSDSLRLLLPNRLPAIFPSLQFLSIKNCLQLESFPEEGFPLHLQTLHIQGCQNLSSLPDMISLCTSLQKLNIDSCPKLELFPASGLPPNLLRLEIINCGNLKSLPERIYCTLKCLKVLHISGCPEIESFPQGGLPLNLKTLHVTNCNQLFQKYGDWQLQSLFFLKELAIEGFEDADPFPANGSLPYGLILLLVKNFPNLRLLNCRELNRVYCLRELKIVNCPSLCAFSEDLPQSLCNLSIRRCPLVMARCQAPDGPDFSKISHITCVDF